MCSQGRADQTDVDHHSFGLSVVGTTADMTPTTCHDCASPPRVASCRFIPAGGMIDRVDAGQADIQLSRQNTALTGTTADSVAVNA